MRNHLVEAHVSAYSGGNPKAIQALTDEQAARLRELGWTVPEDRSPDKNYLSMDLIGSLTELETTYKEFPQFEISIKKMRGINYDVGFDVARLANGQLEQNYPVHTQINQVSVSNVGLHDVTAVTWMEDACTEQLQLRLDDGWRIIAVCPPNDSRRPTYILGHIQRSMLK
jgi:hypothetical protein